MYFFFLKFYGVVDLLICDVFFRLVFRDFFFLLFWEEVFVLFDILSLFRFVWNGRNLFRIWVRVFLLYLLREKLDLFLRRFGVFCDNLVRLGSEGFDWSEWELRIWLRLFFRSCSICRFGSFMIKGLRFDVGFFFREIIGLCYYVYFLFSFNVILIWWIDI